MTTNEFNWERDNIFENYKLSWILTEQPAKTN